MGNKTSTEESSLETQNEMVDIVIKRKEQELREIYNILDLIKTRMMYYRQKFMTNITTDTADTTDTTSWRTQLYDKKPTFEMPEFNMPSWGSEINSGPDPQSDIVAPEIVAPEIVAPSFNTPEIVTPEINIVDPGPSEPLDDVVIQVVQQPQSTTPTYVSNNPTYTDPEVPITPEVQIPTDPAVIVDVANTNEVSNHTNSNSANVDEQPSMITLAKFNALNDKFDMSQNEINKLQLQYNDTKKNYDNLQSKYTDSQAKYTELQNKYNAIANVNDANAVLKMRYDTLEKTNNELQLKYRDTQSELAELLGRKNAIDAELKKCKAKNNALSPYLPEKIINAATEAVSLASNGVSTIIGTGTGRRVSHNLIAGDQGICMFKQMPNKQHAVSCTKRCRSGYYPIIVGHGDNYLKYETMCIPGKRPLRYGDVINCDTEFKVYNQHRGSVNAPRFKTIDKDEVHNNPEYRMSNYTCDDVKSMF